MRVFIKTFGCRTNIYDSQLISQYLKESAAQISSCEKDANVIIINGCTVTNGADNGTLSYIRSAKAQNPLAKIILTGCAAAAMGKKLYEQGIIDGVLGASKKPQIAKLLKQEKFYEQGDLGFIDSKFLSGFSHHTKAFIKIQEGCDFNCSYCIIPSVRGRSRSLAAAKILEQIAALVDRGYSEFVLTGTNIGSYGKEWRASLGSLLAKIGQINGLKRLRLGSLEPAQLDESFLELINEPWLERHLHIALQHTHPFMLKLMRRRNKALKDLALFERLRASGYALGTDFIVAHPGESEQIWQEALANFKRYPITHLHAFIYSPRANTHSVALLDQFDKIDAHTAKSRLKQLQNIVNANNFAFRKEQAKEKLEVLIEQKKGDFWVGYDQFYNQFKVASKQDLAKKWLIFSEYQITPEGNFKDLDE